MKKYFYLIIFIILFLICILTYVIEKKIDIAYLLGSLFFLCVFFERLYEDHRDDIYINNIINKFDERSELVFYKSRAKVNMIIQNLFAILFLLTTSLKFLNLSYCDSDVLMVFSMIIYITISILNIYFNRKIDMEG